LGLRGQLAAKSQIPLR